MPRASIAVALLCLSLVAAAVLAPADAAAVSAVDFVPLPVPEPAAGQRLGASVSVDGDVVVAGAPGTDDVPGAVYVFTLVDDDWQTERLTPLESGHTWQAFGAAVAFDSGIVAVGAPAADFLGTDSGAVYVFEQIKDGWSETRLLAPDGSAHDRFGASVALDGGRLVVGAPEGHPDPSDDGPGTAYVFDRAQVGSWPDASVLFGAEPGDRFGTSVAVAGDRVVVGAPKWLNLHQPGLAYVFERSRSGGWQPGTELGGVETSRFDAFGYSVDLSDTTISVGAGQEDANAGSQQGAVYVFTQGRPDAWSRERLEASDADPYDEFGRRVAIADNRLLVGAPGGGRGAIYLLTEGAVWVSQKVQGLGTGSWFGDAVALSDRYAVVGAWGENTHGTTAGAVYVSVFDRFIDDNESTFEADIEWMARHDITQGCNLPENDRFCPEDPVTRGQMAAFLARALKLPLPSPPSTPFIDASGTFGFEIARIYDAGITRGCNPPINNRYCPDEYVTRGQMAAFLGRALDYTDIGDGNLFIDDNGTTFENDIDKLGTAGVTKGCNPPVNDRYCPNEYVTRGQMAAFLHRAIGDG